MYKTNFRGLSLKAFNERGELNINSFKGVDYSSSAFNVSDNRAIDILNLIFKDNVIQKRKGFKHVLSLTDKGKIHNIVKFQDGYIIHCGTKLYVANESFIITNQVSNATLLDKRVTMLEKNNRLYVLSGIKYFYLDNNFVVHNCEDDAYIPTTTIGIVNTNIPNNSIQNADNNRTSLDKVNNLSSLVINEFITGTRIDSETKDLLRNTYTKYLLDNKIDKEKYKQAKLSLPELPTCAKPDLLNFGVAVSSNVHHAMVFYKNRTDLNNKFMTLSLSPSRTFAYIYEQLKAYNDVDESKYVERYLVINPKGFSDRYGDVYYNVSNITSATIFPSGSRKAFIYKSDAVCIINDIDVSVYGDTHNVVRVEPKYEFSNKNITFLPPIFDNCKIQIRQEDGRLIDGAQGRTITTNTGETNWQVIFDYRYLFFTLALANEFVSGNEYQFEILDENNNVLIQKKVTISWN